MEKESQWCEFDISSDFLTRGDIIARGFERCLRSLGHNYKVSFRNEKRKKDGKEKTRAVFTMKNF